MKISVDGRVLWVNFHHLYCFYVVVTEGSLTRAARVIGIGQSALSIQMKQFEEHLGFSLFERAHRSLQANERGKIVFSYAKEIFRLGGEMIETLFDRPTATRLHLRIGALDTIPKHLMLEIVDMALASKSCSVSVLEGKPAALLEELLEHRIDLMCTNVFPTADPGKVQAKRIARLPLWVVGATKFKKLANGFPKSLRGQPVIMPTADSHVRHEFEHYCKRHDVQADTIVEAQDVMVQKLVALRGAGMTVVPEFAVREYLEKGELHLIGKLQGSFEEIFLVSATRKIENPVASSLMRKFTIAARVKSE
jgi:LysR family transcriptional activator of nhaA